MIRFKEGMGPGSEHYKRSINTISERQDDIKTIITYGKTSLNYGKTGASGVGGALHHLYDICHEGACDSTPFDVESMLANQAYQKFKLDLNAVGQYNGLDERNMFVDGLVAAASQGEDCQDVKWRARIGFGGPVRQCTQTNFISINRFRGGLLQGFIQVRVDRGNDEKDGWCGKITAGLGGVAGIVGVVPAAAAPGAVLSGFFGIISAFCS